MSESLTLPELTDEVVEGIGRIGRSRSPAEACGMLLGDADDSSGALRVVELPNRSMRPQDEYEIWGSDLGVALDSHQDAGFQYVLAIWHTHPKGTLGPSHTDLQNTLASVPMLLVTLMGDGRNIPEWF